MKMNLHEAIIYGMQRLESMQRPDSRTDSKLLLEYITGIPVSKHIMNYDRQLSLHEIELFNECLTRRLNNEPIQYITNRAYFMGYEFYVDNSVLIPRFDTEVLVDTLIKKTNDNFFNPKILDLCTGSGCIAISIAKLFKAKVYASDVSDDALQVAKKNAEVLAADVNFIKSDLFNQIYDKFDIIVSNPPYITSQQMTGLEEQVIKYEPSLALCGGHDGLDFYREIIKDSIYHLNKNGLIFFEVGFNQSDDVIKILEKYGFIDIAKINDLNKIARVVFGCLK